MMVERGDIMTPQEDLREQCKSLCFDLGGPTSMCPSLHEPYVDKLEYFAREIRKEALEEAQQEYLDHDFETAYARVCALVHGGNPDEQASSTNEFRFKIIESALNGAGGFHMEIPNEFHSCAMNWDSVFPKKESDAGSAHRPSRPIQFSPVNDLLLATDLIDKAMASDNATDLFDAVEKMREIAKKVRTHV